MIEIPSKRTYTAKHFDLGNGIFKTDAHIGHIHYKDANGDFQDSDIKFVDMGMYWEMTKHNYHLRVIKDFSAPVLIQYKNVWEGANHTITYEPVMLAWVNQPDLSDMVVFRNQQAVQGVLDGSVIKYVGAFGVGIDFEITLMRSGFKKEIVIQSLASLETPPTVNHKLVALFKYGGTGLTVKDAKTQTAWDGNTYMESQNGYELQEADPVKKSLIRPAYIKDATHPKNPPTPIKVFWKQRGGFLYQAKVLPKAFLANATYPVRADTVTSYYTGGGDGYFYVPASASWATVHGSTNASSSSWTDTGGYPFYLDISGGNYYLLEAAFPIDTSGLTSGATITGAKFYAATSAGSSRIVNDNDAQAYSVITPVTFANTAAPTGTDFPNRSTTEWSDHIADTATPNTADTYWFYTFNSTGLSGINKTGYTDIMIQEGHDLENSAHVARNSNSMAYSEYTGTSSDPYLEVTYTTGGGTSYRRRALLGVGQ